MLTLFIGCEIGYKCQVRGHFPKERVLPHWTKGQFPKYPFCLYRCRVCLCVCSSKFDPDWFLWSEEVRLSSNGKYRFRQGNLTVLKLVIL